MKVNLKPINKNTTIAGIPSGKCFNIIDDVFHRSNQTSEKTLFFKLNWREGFTNFETGVIWDSMPTKTAIRVEAEVVILKGGCDAQN